ERADPRAVAAAELDAREPLAHQRTHALAVALAHVHHHQMPARLEIALERADLVAAPRKTSERTLPAPEQRADHGDQHDGEAIHRPRQRLQQIQQRADAETDRETREPPSLAGMEDVQLLVRGGRMDAVLIEAEPVLRDHVEVPVADALFLQRPGDQLADVQVVGEVVQTSHELAPACLYCSSIPTTNRSVRLI